MPLPDNPITRREIYLASIAAKNTELPAFPITREEQYLDYIARHDGSSVVSDYDDLTDKPLINSNTLSGDKAGNDLGLLDLSGGTMTGAINMGGNSITGLADGVNDTDAVTKRQLDVARIGALKPQGAVVFSSLPAPSAAVLNNLYNITDAFSTTSDFIEGAGLNYSAGTNVAIINAGSDLVPVYKYDAMPGIVDTSNFLTKSGLADSTGNSTQNAMSQNAVTLALAAKQDTLSFPELAADMTQPVTKDTNGALWTTNYKSDIVDTQTALSVALFGRWHENEYETHEVTLTNIATQPFNTTLDSPVSVPLTVVRANLYYTVEYEITAHTGLVGEVIISDKALNGFKVSFTGSATSVTLTLRIKGGIK